LGILLFKQIGSLSKFIIVGRKPSISISSRFFLSVVFVRASLSAAASYEYFLLSAVNYSLVIMKKKLWMISKIYFLHE